MLDCFFFFLNLHIPCLSIICLASDDQLFTRESDIPIPFPSKLTCFLQTCEPAILPPLKEIYPRNMVDDLTGTHQILVYLGHISDLMFYCISACS